MPFRSFFSACLLFWLSGAGALCAYGAQAPVTVGAAKEDVLAAYGRPTGQSKAGAKEILNYPQGSVTLVDGRVLRVDFKAGLPSAPARQRPALPSGISANVRAPIAAGVEKPPTAAPIVAKRTNVPEEPVAVASGWWVAWRHALRAVAIGGLVTALLIWLLWRDWSVPPPPPPPRVIADRIAAASSGLPTYAEIVTWPKERVLAVAAGFAEAQGYAVDFQPAGSEKDIVFGRAEEERKIGVICGAGADAGVITVKRVRELCGLMTAEGFQQGWFVAPMGFAADARVFADRHKMRLVDGHGLLATLRELPPVSVPNVVTREPWARA